MADFMRLPKFDSKKTVMRTPIPTSDEAFDPKQAKSGNPSPQTVLQMQQTFGNQATIQMLRQQNIQRDFGLSDMSGQLVAHQKEEARYKKAAKDLKNIFGPAVLDSKQMLSGTFATFKTKLTKKERAELTFDKILANINSDIFERFYKHAETELATDALDFYKEVEEYKKSPSVPKAQAMYDKWMEGSWAPLNVGVQAKRGVVDNINALPDSKYGNPIEIASELEDDDDYPGSQEDDAPANQPDEIEIVE